jgi:molybdate transport system substrate-binding protein
VPIGRYTQQILQRAGGALGADFPARVQQRVVSRELSVRRVMTKVLLGEAQVGVVYRTDAMATGRSLKVVAIPAQFNVVAQYPIAETLHPVHPELARAWVGLVLSPKGKERLRAAGFLPAPEGGAER